MLNAQPTGTFISRRHNDDDGDSDDVRDNRSY